jgi:tetratricopeptide (TPR) repeat protein
MRRPASFVLIGVLLGAAACAPRTIAVPVVTSPRFPEFIQPTVPPELAGNAAVSAHIRSWAFLQAGDVKNAEREAAAALKVSPSFFPSEATTGYVDLAQKNAKSALSHFDRALEQDGGYVPALVGRGQALEALDRGDDAVGAFEAALARDPSLTDVGRRVQVLKFRGLERNLAAARDAARDGRSDEAIRAYLAALDSSPESAFLYRELGAIERQRGQAPAALAHFRKAIELDPSDAGTWAQAGDLMEAQGDVTGALDAYTQALSLEPGAGFERRRDELRAKADFALLPEQYRTIASATEVTRGALAALIGVRLAPLLQGRQRDVGVVTDVVSHWAEPWIFPVVQTGVMEPFPNHTFQPSAVVRRVDLAETVNRLLARVAATAPASANQWRNARVQFPDLAAGNIAYPAASASVAAGVITAAADGSFQASRVVTGEEAIAAIERLQTLANIPGAQSIARP